jgi:hypothetical protein
VEEEVKRNITSDFISIQSNLIQSNQTEPSPICKYAACLLPLDSPNPRAPLIASKTSLLAQLKGEKECGS